MESGFPLVPDSYQLIVLLMIYILGLVIELTVDMIITRARVAKGPMEEDMFMLLL